MSASLVGSEMCIRDSLWRVLAIGTWPVSGHSSNFHELADVLSDHARSLQAFGAKSAWLRKRPRNWHPKLSRGSFCA
eukprot:9865144-Alexandrium_andersonii.AAC.1